MKDIQKIVNDLKEIKVHPQGDLSDLGNEIGKIIGVYIDNQEIGYELDDLLAGIEHGVSLTDGTHTQVELSRGCCSNCGEGLDNEEEWKYNTECELCGEPIPEHKIIKRC